MRIIYTIGIYCYTLGIRLAALFGHEKARQMVAGWKEVPAAIHRLAKGKTTVWFHAASLGEFEQARPVLERYRELHPDHQVLLTFFSPSGYEVRKNYPLADAVCYLPPDTPRNARRMVDTVHPSKVFFVKYEFWYNYLHILKHRQVPVYSVSSIFRPDQVFFRWYGRQYGRVLKCFTRFFVQNEQSRQLLKTLGITDVDVVGDTRFDRVLQIKEQAKQLPISLTPDASQKGEGSKMSETPKVFIAGSSWPPDEDIFIRYFNEHREWTLIIAPHVIGEDHLQQIEEKLKGWHVTRYTSLATSSSPWICAPGKALIIDCFGLLSSIYRYGQVAYVGGGFGVGIHNVVEAAVWGMPVFFGPNNQKFQEAQGLKRTGGGIEISSYDDFAHRMNTLNTDAEAMSEISHAAGSYVAGQSGATEKIFQILNL